MAARLIGGRQGLRLFVTASRAPASRPGEGEIQAQTLRLRLFKLQGRRWQILPEPGTPGSSTFRPFATAADDLCALFTENQRDGERSAVRAQCLTEGAWQELQPELPADQFARATAEGIVAVRGQLHAGVLDLGLPNADRTKRPDITWTILRRDSTAWVDTELGTSRPGWNAQGSLHSIAGQAWAILFEQRDLSSRNFAIEARVVVRRLDRGVQQVGQPLIANQEIYGPIHYSLAQIGRRIYVLYSDPNPSTSHNDIRVAVLKP